MNERSDEKICEECGNDLVCEGYRYCSECLEALEIDDDFMGIDPDNDFTVDTLAGLLPDLSDQLHETPPEWAVGQDEDPVVMEGRGYGGIPDFVRPWREAIQVALKRVENGDGTAPGYCLRRTREYYGVLPLYNAAKDSLAAAQRAGKAYEVGFDEVDQIPRGSVVYWIGPNSQYGHVAIAIGGGLCVSTDWPTGRFGKVDIATLARAWGYTHIFWSPLINDVRVWAPSRWVEFDTTRVPGIWQFTTDAAPGRVRPNSFARILDEREAGEKFFPVRAIKHEGKVWFKGQDGHWYRRSDVEFVRKLREDER